MEMEIVGADIATEWTDTPRALTDGEKHQVCAAGRLNGIKLHRQLTSSSLKAAISAVDAILASE